MWKRRTRKHHALHVWQNIFPEDDPSGKKTAGENAIGSDCLRGDSGNWHYGIDSSSAQISPGIRPLGQTLQGSTRPARPLICF